MNTRHHVPWGILYLLLSALAGCRTAPIYNVAGAPITTPRPVEMVDIQNAIVRAGAGLGWAMKPVTPGHLIGTLHIRNHTAVVDILYNPRSYDITYKDSVNLKQAGGEIHKNYNAWIQNLDHAIKMQLSGL
ncbi:MAG: hypothetical protein ACREWG_13550 [Gammaproteobacteria bacterium]